MMSVKYNSISGLEKAWLKEAMDNGILQKAF